MQTMNTILVGAVLTVGCAPDNLDDLHIPPTFGSELASVAVEDGPDRLTITALDNAGMELGELALRADDTKLVLSSDYSDDPFVAVIDRSGGSGPMWTWPTALGWEDLRHRAKLIEDMLDENDACAVKVTRLVQLCVMKEFAAGCTETTNEVACECLQAVAKTCPS
jgi:hypothetical protein